MKKLCFVIMGFGKKTDYSISKTYNLDATYKNIIKPSVEAEGYRCIRADEIKDSAIIDKSMYALLVKADLVIADITTYNPNVIYELGIRHASRPHKTIIMKNEESVPIPFDLSHSRIFSYSHLGDDIGVDECKRCQNELKALINAITRGQITDSPFYEYIPNIPPHVIDEQIFETLISELADKEESVYLLSEKAQINMKQNKFQLAADIWHKLSQINPSEVYYVQQRALCLYKSEYPSVGMACLMALEEIIKINPNESIDPETLGITGAIYKNLWLSMNDLEMLRKAINTYKRGYQNTYDHYTGENYALCLDMLKHEIEGEEKIYCKFEANRTRMEIVNNLRSQIESDKELSDYWKIASMAHCLFALGRCEEANEYEFKFLSMDLLDWERETYLKSKKMAIQYIE